MRATCVLLLGMLGCYHGNVVMDPKELAHVASALREHGTVEVAASENSGDAEWHKTTATVALADRVDVTLGQHARDERLSSPTPTTFTKTNLSIAELLANCPSGAFDTDDATRLAYPRCVLFAAREPSLVIGHRRFAPTGTTATVVTLGAIGGLAACTFECPRPWSTISGGALIVTGGVVVAAVVAVVVYVYAIAKYD